MAKKMTSRDRTRPDDISLRAKLMVLADSAHAAERRVASFILGRYNVASDYSITELASAAGVSNGTVSKLCRNVGLAGYSDLRFALARDAVVLQANDGATRGAIEVAESPAARAIRDAFSANIEALTETQKVLDPNALEQAAGLISRAGRVEVVGIASSASIAAEATLKLRKLGVPASFQADSHAQVMSANVLNKSDVLLVFSHSGRTKEVVRSAELAKRRGAKVVAVTGMGDSPLHDFADVVLGFAAHDTAFRVEATASSVAALSIVHALFLMLLIRHAPALATYQRAQEAVEGQERKHRATGRAAALQP